MEDLKNTYDQSNRRDKNKTEKTNSKVIDTNPIILKMTFTINGLTIKLKGTDS